MSIDNYHWYNSPGTNSDIVIISRIRLIRNLKDWPFPNRLSDQERAELMGIMQDKLKDLDTEIGQTINMLSLSELSLVRKSALLERQIINKAAFTDDKNVDIYISRDEGISLTLNETDHFRLIQSKSGQELNTIWESISKIDDYINSRFNYAYHKKFGYMTAYPTNLGTGMRGYYVLHLPFLSAEKNFGSIVQEMTRYGVVIKPALNYKNTDSCDLYLLYNQRTLGLTEKEIIQVLTKVANRLISQERALRAKMSRIEVEDRVYRSYGILRYAKKLSLAECFEHLSNITLGISQKCLKCPENVSIYEIILGILPGNLQYYYNQIFDENDIDQKRAEFIQEYISAFEDVI